MHLKLLSPNSLSFCSCPMCQYGFDMYFEALDPCESSYWESYIMSCSLPLGVTGCCYQTVCVRHLTGISHPKKSFILDAVRLRFTVFLSLWSWQVPQQPSCWGTCQISKQCEWTFQHQSHGFEILHSDWKCPWLLFSCSYNFMLCNRILV